MNESWHDLADPEMIEWCARLNAVPGISTRQSCSGHKVGGVGKAEGLYRYEASAGLWFICRWITDGIALELARIPTMEHVRLLFHPWNDGDDRFIWDLAFQGKNRDKLDESMQSILSILEKAKRGKS